MNSKKIIYLILLFAFIIISCDKEITNDVVIPEEPKEKKLKFPRKEMRAVWITTAWGLDWPQGIFEMKQQKEIYIEFLEKFKELNINTVFVQVKAMGDAIYQSSYEPWSKEITGVRGGEPQYDVLKFMIDEAHSRGIEIHAWINPFRIAHRPNASIPYPKLHKSINPDWVINHEKIQIYNPAIPEVRNRLADIIKELITKYEIDGIHLDDYFYPDPKVAGIMKSDKNDFSKYNSGETSIEDFRRNNVSKTIELIHKSIIKTKPQIVFSLSPTANNKYNYKILFADVTKWCKKGWIDIVIPQLYHEIGNKHSDFQSNLTWWSQYSYKAKLMIGHGFYRFGDPKSSQVFQSPKELEKQFDLTRRNKKVVGNAMYRAKYLLLNKIGITEKLASIYKRPALIPFIGRSVEIEPKKPTNVRIESSKLKWDTAGDVKSVVYYFPDTEKMGAIYAITNKKEILLEHKGSYCVTVVNADNKESKPSDLFKR